MLPIRHLLAACLAVPAAALAQTQAPSPTPPADTPPAILLPPIGVTATRGPKPIDQVPETVSIISEEQLERRDAVRPSDIVRYEPGVSVGNQPARGGQTNFVIRGIGENRVLILQDGLRVQDFPGSNIGAGNYTRNYIDLDTLKRVEIVRGPVSALYGSDALGGVVNFILKDPSDYLDLTGRDVFVSGKFGYNGSDMSVHETVTGAARSGNTEFMLMYTRRDGHETGNVGTPGANPQTYLANAILARLVSHPTDADTIRLTAEYNDLLTWTDVLTEVVTSPGTRVFASDGKDLTQRGNVVLDWEHGGPLLFMDTIRGRLSWSRLERTEWSDVSRAVFTGPVPPAAPNRRRLSDFKFDQDLWIADLQATSVAAVFGSDHRFTYGGTLELTNTSRPRDRTEINLTTGVTTSTVAGETFPSKNFPDTRTINVGLFVQDEVTLGRLDLLPAMRVDVYSLKPFPDAAFRRNSGVVTVNPLNEVAFSPKFGALFHVTEEYAVYGQYAHGFRAPPYDTTNFGFTNFAQGYQIIPNGNLKSESSDGFEAGLRGRFARGSFQVNAFYNQYSDFIDTQLLGIVRGLMLFQYRNLPEVRIWGSEARGELLLLPGLFLRGAIAWARGENVQTGAPIDSVDPVRMTTGLHYQHASGLGAEAILTHAWQHDRVSVPTYFKAPPYTVIDLLAHYDLHPNLRLNGGVFNVTNAKYFISQDVNGVAANNPNRDLYTQPGRYFAFNVTARW
ncbi:MAG: TonB-dependent hemoglobin/transferrin/lactoferrin family receptor [Acetobacteraceae bacterium]